MVGGGVKILLAVKDCDRVRREKETIFREKIVVDVDTHEDKGRGGRSCSLVEGGDGGVPGLKALFLSSDGPLNVSVFYRKIVARSSSPMTSLVKISMF